MKPNFNSPVVYLRVVHAMSLLVPFASRSDWRREWDAEIITRWQKLQKWNQLNLKSKLDLWARVTGAARDVASFDNNKPRLVLVVLNILVALLLGFGAVQEFALSGIRHGRLQILFLSSAAILVSILFIVSAVAMLRESSAVRTLVFVTGVLSLLVHVYGALPPQRNMGYLALLLGAGYAGLMMLVYQINAVRQRV